jgi:hypothetical protein
VADFIEEYLDLDPSTMHVQRAHRVGAPNKHKIRPIIVNFVNFKDVEVILENAYKLKGTKFGINRDYPREIVVARSKLWPLYKKEKANKRNKVHIGYPAKLIVNKKVIKDEFPEWQTIMQMSRITGFETFPNNNTEETNETTEDTIEDRNIDKDVDPVSTQNKFDALMISDKSDSETEESPDSDTAEAEEETDQYSQDMKILSERCAKKISHGRFMHNDPEDNPINLSLPARKNSAKTVDSGQTTKTTKVK